MIIQRVTPNDRFVHREMKATPSTVAAFLSDPAVGADQLTQARDEAGVVTFEDACLMVANTDYADDVVVVFEPLSEVINYRIQILRLHV